MSAANSLRGQHFADKHAHLNFVVAQTIESADEIAPKVKYIDHEDCHRDMEVFGQAYIVCRETEAEARAFHNHYVNEKGDWEGVRNLLDVLIPNAKSALDDGWKAMAVNLIADYRALPLIGTADQLVEGMQAFSDAGIDGITLSWVDYVSGLAHFKKTCWPE